MNYEFANPEPVVLYFVVGGIFSNFDFIKLDPNHKIETHGTFYSYQDAYDAWKKNAWLNVDNALHRLRIEKLDLSTVIY